MHKGHRQEKVVIQKEWGGVRVVGKRGYRVGKGEGGMIGVYMYVLACAVVSIRWSDKRFAEYVSCPLP